MVELNPTLEPPIKVCTELSLPAHMLGHAAEEAKRINRNNQADGNYLQDAIRVFKELGSREPELAAAVLLTSKRWRPGTQLKVAWMRDQWTENDMIRERIRYYINRLERWMNLQFRFIGFNPDEADVRISMERGGSASYLGPDILLIPKDKPTMWLGWLTENSPDEEYRRTPPHEACHTGGFGHEHQNPHGGLRWNLEAVYRYYNQNQGWSREETMYQVIRRYAISSMIGTERDPESLMHYGIPASLLLDPLQAVGWNTDVSETDKRFFAQVYPY